MYDYTQALRRSELSRARWRRPAEVSLLGREWTLLPNVFSPADTNSSLTHLELLDFPVGGSFLEIGSGMGIIAVHAALAGCRSVVATDLNPAAVENTARNAERFGVADRVRCVHSDLFDQLPEHATFDVVYWHSNNVWTPPSVPLDNVHALAYVDPGYAAHRRFFQQAPGHRAPGGRVLLAVSSRASRSDLDELAARAGQRLHSVKATTVPEPEGPVVYELLEVVPG
ncbi:release factor glutamine methyltransferase [Amycolatopsis arida]|uniref:Release factor glutamine methyltransferase n=2 Tax=Amycolatopsis arida TaxID=587909 RepID=A0A1I5V7B8_9PSEU|nr:release factor glutamine methyltransferase [Amycolatopsis arida]SFQ03424.1 release factor glutamine methyltransferase [Amycolatopsis arida]